MNPSSDKASFFPFVNTLRGVGTFAICLFHLIRHQDQYGEFFPAEHWLNRSTVYLPTAVALFFVISGFVIPLSQRKYNFEWSKAPRYLLRRIVRIEPPYLITVVLTLLLSAFFALHNGISPFPDFLRLFSHLFYLAPFVGQEWYNPIFWTLAIEFQFYIVIVFFFPLLSHSKALIRYSSILVFAILPFFCDDHRWVFHYTSFFAVGFLAYDWMSFEKRKWLSFVLYTTLVACLFIQKEWPWALVASATGLAIVLFRTSNRWLNQLGSMSYSLYLTHGLSGGTFLYFTARYVHGNAQKMLLLLAAIVVAITFSYLFRKFVEEPSIRYSKKIH